MKVGPFPAVASASLLLALALFSCPARAAADALRVAVLDDAPPMAYRDAAGNLTGFSHAIAQALCEEMKRVCEFQVTRLDRLVDDLAAGRYDVAALGLLNTPARRERILFSQPVYRSITLWLAAPKVQPGQAHVRVATFRGSVQENYVKAKGWPSIAAQTSDEMLDQLSAGVAQAIIVPLMTSFSLQKNPRFLAMGLRVTPLRGTELDGDACFGISPRQAALKQGLDKALETIRRNGVYDRINTRFLPFRVY